MRDADNTDIVLPFYNFQELGTNFSMSDLLTSIFKIKSHKFDFNYEMFLNIKVSNNKSNDTTTLNVYFDHGS